MSLKNGFFALIFTLISINAWAMDSCHLEGKITLDRDTVYDCHDKVDGRYKDLVIASDTHIITNGYALTFRSEAGIVDQGMKIDSYESSESAQHGQDAGPIFFYAESVSGNCQYIHNTGLKDGSGGGVQYKLMTLDAVEGGSYKCRDFTTAGVGQGQEGGVYASANNGEIPFSEFKAHVID